MVGLFLFAPVTFPRLSVLNVERKCQSKTQASDRGAVVVAVVHNP
jgi:hypothetical protein